MGLISFHISISKAVYIKILDVGSMCSRQLSTSLYIEKKVSKHYSRGSLKMTKYPVRNKIFVCLGFLVHIDNFSLIWRRHRPLPVKGCKFGPLLDTDDHWAVRALKRATPTVIQNIRLYGHLRSHLLLRHWWWSCMFDWNPFPISNAYTWTWTNCCLKWFLF